MIKVVYYARVSTEEEKQINALKIQREEAEEFIATQSDWILVDKYVDEGISGTIIEKRD
ncbi:recombinase family protein, partial [Desulfosporosinus metallidurans]|uniref:recombinase family protein n=1 Tax=Desulfosporosinus metallidurans TaxID=1888891 RepID=UPI000AD3C7DA